jgi:hypothetical protein
MILIDIELLKIILDNASCVRDGLASGFLTVTIPDEDECTRLTKTIINSQEMIIGYVRDVAHAAVSASQDEFASSEEGVMVLVPATPIEA